MPKITSVTSIQILDSRGNPTLKTEVHLDDGMSYSASIPSGASVGKHEAQELRDNDKREYGGKGVLKAVSNVNKPISSELMGKEPDPKSIDLLLINLDGTENKSRLGANAILSVSLAVARAAAGTEKIPLWKYLNSYYFDAVEPSFPRIMVNMINGGLHANWNFDIQEFMVVPNSNQPTISVKVASEIFHSLGALLEKKGLVSLVGDEGGYSPALSNNQDALSILEEAASFAGFSNVKDYRLSLDIAASEIYKEAKYHFKKDGKSFIGKELIDYYLLLEEKYKILSFEDPFAEDDWVYSKEFTTLARKYMFTTIGDDLFTTNPLRIKRGIYEKSATGVLIKPNQIGTLTETVDAIKLAKDANWKVAVSHRSGETDDSFIADLAYSCAADFLKAGATSRSERLSKYNRLIEIEESLNPK